MQNTTTPAAASTPANVIITYGLFALSLQAILFVGLARLFGRADQATAINVIFIVLGGNGLVISTQWQAAPGPLSQFTNHIQARHRVQIQSIQPVDLLNTTKTAVPPGPTLQMPATPIPQAAQPAIAQLPFPVSPSASLGGLQSALLSAQSGRRLR